MSSLAAAGSDNYYYPKGWDPSKGSINTFHKSHPLGKRAKDLHHGILVVRFEMPFNVWCTHCETHIGKGVRFNAKKKKTGMYFTTPIYSFELTCATCKGIMVVQTNPKESTYTMVSGIREQYPSLMTDMPESHAEDAAVAPFEALEKAVADKKIGEARESRLEKLLRLQKATTEDSYSSNSALRKSFRQQKKVIQAKKAYAKSLGLSIPLLDSTEEDRVTAASIVFKRSAKRKSSSIFASSSSSTTLVCTKRQKARDRAKKTIKLGITSNK